MTGTEALALFGLLPMMNQLHNSNMSLAMNQENMIVSQDHHDTHKEQLEVLKAILLQLTQIKERLDAN